MGSHIPTPPAFSQRSGPTLTHELAAKNLLQEASYAMAATIACHTAAQALSGAGSRVCDNRPKPSTVSIWFCRVYMLELTTSILGGKPPVYG